MQGDRGRLSVQRALVAAFAESPSLAAELVRKAMQLQETQVATLPHVLSPSIDYPFASLKHRSGSALPARKFA